jgi:FSR family fosmidomycin resistance protein-like MFS transporter
MKRIGPKKGIDFRGLGLLCLGHLAIDLNSSALPAILPFLKEALDISYAIAGTIILFSSLTSSVVQPFFGYLTDRKSLFWFLPVGCFCAALGMALLGWAKSYSQILLLVILSGLGIAIYHPEGWRIANFFAGEKKATSMSIFAVGGNLGFALGPLLAVFLVKNLGLKGSIYFLIPGSAMAGIFLLTKFWRNPRKVSIPPRPSPTSTSPSLKSPFYPMSLLIGMVMLRSWAQTGILIFMAFYYINYMKGDPMQAGNLLSGFLMAGTLGTLVGGPLADRFGHKKIILLSLGLSSPVLFLFLLSTGVWSYILFMLAGFILVVSFSVSMVLGQSFMPRNLGMASGLILGLSVGTGGIGAAILGLFADHWGVPSTLWIIAFIPWVAFILGALIPSPE